MKLTTYITALFFAMVLTTSCDKEPPITDAMLDGNIIFDPSLYNPDSFLVSAKYPTPSADDLSRHVLIAIHGYSASTFEWQEFQDWSTDSSYRISQVLLDGHGRTYADFKASKWEDWRDAVTKEYEALEALGYTKISLVGSSTGGPLILELMSSGYFNNHVAPKNAFLIDAIVVPTVKLQSIAGIVGPMLVYVEADQDPGEEKYWYTFRPQETVNELNDLIKEVRQSLENGVKAPAGTYVKMFHSKLDPTASTTSAVLTYKGLTLSNGNKIDVQIMDSEIHVFTRLSLRPNVTALEISNQQDAFSQMARRLK
jgi:carboxylesterase